MYSASASLMLVFDEAQAGRLRYFLILIVRRRQEDINRQTFSVRLYPL